MGRKSKFSDAEILGAVHDIEGGATQTDVSRRLGVSTQTLQRWRAKYSGMSVPEVQEKRRLEEENRKLRALVAQFALEVESMRVALGKKW